MAGDAFGSVGVAGEGSDWGELGGGGSDKVGGRGEADARARKEAKAKARARGFERVGSWRGSWRGSSKGSCESTFARVSFAKKA